MKRPVFIVLFCLFPCLSAQGAGNDEIVKNGWNVGPLPSVGYNSDLGMQYGLCADIFNYKGVFPDYRDRFYVEASRYTKGQTLLHLQYDSKYLVPGIRTTMSASYQYDPMFLFYGLDGVEPYEKSFAQEGYYYYRRAMTRVLTNFQGNINDRGLSWTAGLSFWKYSLGDIKSDKYDASQTLFHKLNSAGVFSATEASGGSHFEINFGVVNDTRDNQSAPSKGMWSELYLCGSPDIFSTDYSYLKLVAHFRQYLSLGTDRFVFAYHLAYQGIIAGQAPFYSQQNINTLYLRQTCTDGLGGLNTVRGLLAQRLVGDSYAWLNSELRIRLFSFNLINQSWYVALNPLFDAGMVTRLYKGEELSSYYGISQDQLSKEAVKLHCSAGAGLKLVMNRNFIISAEYANPLHHTDGEGTTYITLNYIF